MKFFSAFVVGLVLGVAVALAALYYNPLTEVASGAPLPDDWTLHYELLEDSLAVTHGGRMRLPVKPVGVPQLWENTIAGTVLTVVALRGEAGTPVGVASRISFPSEETALLSRGVILSDYWVLTVPGQGSMFMETSSNVWPVVKRMLAAAYLGRPWNGPATFQLTAGPGLRGTAMVRGATGRFRGLEGSALERYRLEGFDPERGLGELDAQLFLRLLEPAAEIEGR